MSIILASSSPRRKELLLKAGYEFKVIVKEVDESFDELITAVENVKRLGLKKCLAVASEYYNDVVIGCDTIVVLDNIVYGKPKDESDARRMLADLSGKTHSVYSGVGISYKGDIANFVVESKVKFKKLSEDDINNYINTMEPFGKAGAYAIQGIGKKLVEKYEGELENIIGLPIKEVNDIIRRYLK